MPKLLHIQASPRGDRSASIAVAHQFIETYSAAHPDDSIETLDLWTADLPEFNGATLEAKYAVLSGQKHSPEQGEAWARVGRVADQFKAADKYVFSMPMWNFSVPYKFKQWIDVIAQPGMTFSYSPATGFKGLVTGKQAVAIYARGGAYGPGSGAEGYDAQSKYLKQILGFMGITDVKEIFVEPTGASAGEAIGTATETAKSFAREF
jgi:FMN-dependent NADH-azoreductase